MRLIVVIILIFSGCAVLKRSPSSINSSDSIFNLINSENLLQTRYTFELFNLNTPAEKKIVFKSYDISVADSKKALEIWKSDLRNFLSTVSSDVQFKTGTSEVTVKHQDFIRLEQALTLLGKSSDNPETVFRRQVEIVTAFNQNLKQKDLSIADSSFIPIEFSEISNQTSPPAVGSSSFWTNPTEQRQSFRPVDISVDELSKSDCKSVDSEDTAELKISCGPTHFTIQPQISPRVSVLNSILYRRLGYNTPPLVYQPLLEMDYDRISLVKLVNQNLNVRVRLKNGENLNFSQLTEKLLPYCKVSNNKCYSKSAMFDSATENQIEKMELSDVALSVDFGDHEFGSWGIEDLDHRYHREVKALLFVGALTGNGDLRKENNSLIWSAKNFSISHQITNLSSGFGRLHTGPSMNLNAMQWDVLKSKKTLKGTTYFFDGYRPFVKRQAFSDLNIDDAKWAVRKIADLSEGEITEALYHSGFSVAETLLAREKLISIQKNMVVTLGLSPEFPALASRKIDKFLNYRIQRHIQSFDLTPTRSVHVPENDDELYNGILRKKTPTGK